MHLVADESVEAYLVAALRDAGHTVFEIGQNFPGIRDSEVLQLAFDRGHLLITNDKDFGDLVHPKSKSHNGVVLMRLSGMHRHDRCARMVMVIGTHEHELLKAFTTVSPRKIRIRPGNQ